MRGTRGAGRLGVFAATLVTALGAAGVAGPAARAAAAAPVRTAWWNTGPAGVFPAQTGSGQLAVSEGAAGSMAVAGLAYPAGSAPTSGAVLTLTIDGNASFGPAQVQACPVKPDSAGWKAGGNQTTSPPAYDCSRAAAGKLASSGSSVVFTLGPTQAEPDGSYNLVVVPASGALPFQLIIDAPGTSSLAAQPAASGAPATAPAPTGGTQPAPAPSGSPGGASSPAAGSGGSTAPSDQGATLAPTDTSGLAALPVPASPSPADASPVQSTQSAPASSAAGSGAAASGPVGFSSTGSTSRGGSSSTGKILGFAALIIVLVLYSEGFGVLGGRIRPLSSRFGRQPPAGADSVSA